MSSKHEPEAEAQIADLMEKLELTDSSRSLGVIQAMLEPLCPNQHVFQEIISAIMDYGNLVAQEQTRMELMAAIGDADAQRLCSLVEGTATAPFVPGDGNMH